MTFIYCISGSYHERRLYEDLMRDYNNLERPVANHSLPVIVSISHYDKLRTLLVQPKNRLWLIKISAKFDPFNNK